MYGSIMEWALQAPEPSPTLFPVLKLLALVPPGGKQPIAE